MIHVRHAHLSSICLLATALIFLTAPARTASIATPGLDQPWVLDRQPSDPRRASALLPPGPSTNAGDPMQRMADRLLKQEVTEEAVRPMHEALSAFAGPRITGHHPLA